VPSLALVAFVPTSLGFLRTAWAFGYGYALSLGLGGAFLAAAAPRPLPRATSLSALGASAHGLRLALYFFARDTRGAMPEDYKRRVAALDTDTSALGRAKRLPLIASCAAMYSLLMAPLALAVRHPADEYQNNDALAWAGVALQWAGALVAALADAQKHAAKRRRPDRWCDSGLYRCAQAALMMLLRCVPHDHSCEC
jgi:steroid 5-alpha reductase family enzyme